MDPNSAANQQQFSTSDPPQPSNPQTPQSQPTPPNTQELQSQIQSNPQEPKLQTYSQAQSQPGPQPQSEFQDPSQPRPYQQPQAGSQPQFYSQSQSQPESIVTSSPAPTVSSQGEDGGAPFFKKPLFWILTVGLALLIALSIGGLFYVRGKTAEMKQLVEDQVDDFTKLEASYALIVETIKGNEKSQPLESPTRLLFEGEDLEKLASGEAEDLEKLERKGEVLGLESDEMVKQLRKITSQIREAKLKIDEISDTNSKISRRLDSFSFSFVRNEPRDLVRETDDFALKSIALMDYLVEINELTLDSIALGYEIGLTVGEVIARDFDEDSLRTLEGKINQIKSIKEEFATIDTSNLSDSLQEEHRQGLDYFDDSVKIFDDLLTSLKTQDQELFEKTVTSMIIQGARDTEVGKVAQVTFWESE